MALATRRDVRVIRALFSNNNDDGDAWQQDMESFDPSMLKGIEDLLTPALVRNSRVRRIRSLTAVLREQHRQDLARESDPMKIAAVYSYCSRSSVNRAIMLGGM